MALGVADNNAGVGRELIGASTELVLLERIASGRAEKDEASDAVRDLEMQIAALAAVGGGIPGRFLVAKSERFQDGTRQCSLLGMLYRFCR